MRKLTRTSFAIAVSAASVFSVIPSAHAAYGDPTGLGAGTDISGDLSRIAGPDRIGTSLAAAASGLGSGAIKTDTIVLARYDDYPDALTATPIADCMNAPVLLTPTGSLDARILAYIAKNGVKNVLLTGSTGALSTAIEDTLAAKAPTVQVARVGGIDRFQTATFLAKQAVDCGVNGSSGTTLWQDEVTLGKDLATVRAVPVAKAAMDAAKAAMDAAAAAVPPAQAKVDQLQAQLDALSTQLTPTTPPAGYTSWVDYVNQARTANDTAVTAYNTDVAWQKVFTDLLGTTSTTTLNTDSTLDEYIAAYPAKAQAIKDAAANFGVATTDTLNNAIKTSNAKIASDAAVVTSTGTEYAKRYSQWMAAAAADVANQAILKQMATTYNQLAAANAALAAAQAKAAATQAAYLAARDAYIAALNAEKTPAQIQADMAKVAADRAALNAAAGAYPVFLATGMNFPDALSAGAASRGPKQPGVVLLSKARVNEQYTAGYLKASKPQVVAVGGDAAAAIGWDKTAQYFVGSDRYATAALVAKSNNVFPDNATTKPVAIASGQTFADAIIASAYIANHNGALLLTANTNLSAPTKDYLMWHTNVDTTGAPTPGAKGIRIFGGSDVITNTVRAQIAEALNK